ncbi:hypothetical protein NC652_001751 [Populus alba x Populus x berolinensis]|nr:hypothetical protein NC652_001751 [Populus alba x Populus x berolinensis]
MDTGVKCLLLTQKRKRKSKRHFES